MYGADVANRIRQSVMSGKVRVISASTDEEFNSQIVADAQLNTRFQKVDLNRVGELANDETLANKLSPDLLELMASGNPNQLVKVILQSDDIKNANLRALLVKNGVKIVAEAENLNMLVVELPLKVAEAVASMRGAKHLSLDKEVINPRTR